MSLSTLVSDAVVTEVEGWMADAVKQTQEASVLGGW